MSGFRPSVAVVSPSLTARFSALRVVLPGGLGYWTVVDENYELVGAADGFLRDLRFGADRTESTTRLYASEVALFLDWASGSGRDLERAARELSGFVLLLRTTPVARRGRGYGQVRSAGRINHVLSVVREFYKHAVAHGRVSASVIAALFEVGDDRFLPAELRAEDGGLRYRVKPRHQLRAGPSRGARACELSEWEALLREAGCWRDRFLLVLLWFSGLRIGEALGLRRSDMHLMASASELGCRVAGAHLHVVPRENVNGARAKSRRERVVPLAHYVVSYYDLYLDERERCRPARECDFVFVNLFAGAGGRADALRPGGAAVPVALAPGGPWAGGDAAHAQACGGVGADRCWRAGCRAGDPRAREHHEHPDLRARERRAPARRGRARCAGSRAISPGGSARMSALALAALPAVDDDYAGRLAELVDVPALIGRGWDPERRRFVPAPSDPLFGYSRCPVRGCQNVTEHTAAALCRRCQHRYGRWSHAHPNGALDGFLAEVTQVRSQDLERLCLVCRVPGHERPAAAHGLCYSCVRQARNRGQSVGAFVAGDERWPAPRPRATFGMCRMACDALAVGSDGLCGEHLRHWRAAGRPVGC